MPTMSKVVLFVVSLYMAASVVVADEGRHQRAEEWALLKALEERSQRAEEHLSALLYRELHLDLAKQLQFSGLAPLDVEKTIQDVVKGYAACVVSTLADGLRPRSDVSRLMSNELLGVLAVGMSIKEINAYFTYQRDAVIEAFVVEIERQISACAGVVNQEHGLVSR